MPRTPWDPAQLTGPPPSGIPPANAEGVKAVTRGIRRRPGKRQAKAAH
jgi:hypothetical protein